MRMTYQSWIDIGYVNEFIIHLMDFIVFHAALFEIGVGEIQERIATQHTADGTLQDVGSLVGKCLGRIDVLQENQIFINICM